MQSQRKGEKELAFTGTYYMVGTVLDAHNFI